MTRREALRRLGGAAVLGLLSPGALRCAAPGPVEVGDDHHFDLLEVAGSYREIGHAVGVAFRDRILEALRDQPSFESCRAAAHGPQRARVGVFLEAVRARFPHLVDELEGMAEGVGIPFSDLFAWNCRSEIDTASRPCEPGCSTVGWVDQGHMVLAHNEDGAAAYLGRMFVVHASPPSGVPFACLVYPGTLPGNGPGLNARGVVQTTNYIGPCRVPGGIPRYFIGRAVLEAENLEHAVSLATTEGRAFPWHHNLADLPGGRLISLETWPDRHHRREVDGLHLHTNHLIHPEMRDLPERTDYLDRSSLPRLEALERLTTTRPPREREAMVDLLRDHSGSPCRVCRHAGDEVPGVTLAAAVFESPRVEMTLIDGPPCRGGVETVAPFGTPE
jgi:hypothetical protein